MAKAKTSKKRKPFSINDLPITKIKSASKITSHDPDKRLKKVDFIAKALIQSLWEGDMNAFKEIVKAHYESVNTSAVLRNVGLSKRTFYEAISSRGNPRLDTINRIIQGIKYFKQTS